MTPAEARVAELEARWSRGECCQDCPCHGYELGEYTSESIHPELEHRQAARIADLEALSESLAVSLSDVHAERAQAEARLAAVLALCDTLTLQASSKAQLMRQVRAAATGDKA